VSGFRFMLMNSDWPSLKEEELITSKSRSSGTDKLHFIPVTHILVEMLFSRFLRGE
jgi:hypothetical protein